MAIKFEKITAGMTLLDIHSTQMGNTTMRRLGMWEVLIVSVDAERRNALVRWNHNRPEVWSERRLTRLYTRPTKAYLAQQERRPKGSIL